MNIKEALQTALEFEIKGEGIYRDVAEKTKNPVVKRTFKYLFQQEQNHIREIKAYLADIEHPEAVELKGDKQEGVKKFFNEEIKRISEKLELSGDDVKAHENAMELETYAYNFYKEQRDKAGNGGVKKFFETLMIQENAHFQLIQNAHEYIKNPEQFFAEEEKWIVEG